MGLKKDFSVQELELLRTSHYNVNNILGTNGKTGKLFLRGCQIL